MNKLELEQLIQHLESRKRLYEQQLAVSVMDEEGFRTRFTKEELEDFRNTLLELIFVINQEIQFFENELSRKKRT